MTLACLTLRRSDFFRSLAFVLVVFALAGCAKSPPDEVKLRGEITTAADINPDVDGAASPVLVIIFQLANLDVFSNGDFFSLYDPDAAALGPDLLNREQITVQPGETREFAADFDPETKAIGVIVAFRDIENASWKSIAEFQKQGVIDTLNVFKKKKLRIEVEQLSVTATIGK